MLIWQVGLLDYQKDICHKKILYNIYKQCDTWDILNIFTTRNKSIKNIDRNNCLDNNSK